jgi:amino acid transporter
LSWVQGLTIALGVPVLILPSIVTFNGLIGAFAIVIWMLSVFQGFMQNFAYGELASRFPHAPGLPGFAQAVFRGKGEKKYGLSKFVGGLSGWCYMLAWSCVLSIFSITIGGYLVGLIPALADFQAMHLWFDKIFCLGIGTLIFAVLILINWRGVGGGAVAGYLLAALSLIPLLVISLVGIFGGSFEITNITQHLFTPFDAESGQFTSFIWDINGVLLLAGMLAVAQWSACAWETAAIYAPQYKKPRKDIPRALFGCGIICIFTYFLVQTAATGVLGVNGITEHASDPMLAVAKATMGDFGAIISIIMLLAAMVLIIQTAMLGSSNAVASMAEEGNLQSIMGRRNKYGVPIAGMIGVSLLNLVLILLGDSAASILSGSALAYVFANAVALFAFLKVHRDMKRQRAHTAEVPADEIYHAPKGWFWVVVFFGIIQIPIYLVGITVVSLGDYGLSNTILGVVTILVFIPLWFLARAFPGKSNINKIEDYEFEN